MKQRDRASLRKRSAQAHASPCQFTNTSAHHSPHPEEDNLPQGIFTEDEYKLLRAALPDHVKVPLIIGYWTGMRAGEIVMLRWEQIDLERGLLRLEPGTTKNNQGRLVPLVKEVTEALWQWKQRMLLRYPSCPWVCHFRGERLERVPKGAWKAACDRLGLKGKLFHDLRRTAVRNMVRAGISERVAMVISGHKTRSVFDRYDIVSEKDLFQAARCLQQQFFSVRREPGALEGSFGLPAQLPDSPDSAEQCDPI